MSIHFKVIKTFQVPIQQTYEGLLDLNCAKDWMQGLVEIKRLDDGPMRVGSEWIETRKMYGTKASEHFEVVSLDQPRQIVLRCDGTKGTTGKGVFLFTYTLSSVKEGTQITLSGEIQGLTGFSRMMGKLMIKTFKRACEKDLDSLQNFLENSTVETSK